MSQSKSILMPFIIIAALLFGAAVAWKMLGDKETTPVEKKTVETQPVAKVKKPEIKTKPEIKVKNYEPEEPLTATYTEEERKEIKKISKNFMRFSMRFQDESSVEKGLKLFKDNGDKEQFDHLSMFAEENYPDLEIPSFE